MRLTEIHIRGFGALRDFRLNCNAPLTLVYGRNEAGKSTLLNFVRAVLFGFSTRGQGRPSDGGYLLLLDEQGRSICVERYYGTRGRSRANGTVRVVYADGVTGGEAELSALLGGVTPELFRSVFAFGLGELQELGSLQSDEINSYLYSAGLGGNAGIIRDGEKRLAQQMEQLYKPRGKTQPINRTIEQIGELESELRASLDVISRYDSLRTRLSECDGLIAELVDRAKEGNERLQQIKTSIKLSEPWQRAKVIRARLDELPEKEDFPADAIGRLDSLRSEQERLSAELDRYRAKRQQLSLELESLKKPSDVLSSFQAKTELENLLEQCSAYQELGTALAELSAELEHHQTELDKLLRRIDPDWDETALAAFAHTIARREQIREFRDAFARQAQFQLLLQAEEEKLERELETLANETRKQESALSEYREQHAGVLSAFDEADAREWKRHLPSLHKLFSEWQQARIELQVAGERAAAVLAERQALEAAQEQLRRAQAASSRRLSAVLAALALAVPAALLALGRPAEAAVGFAALALAAAAAAAPWLRASRRPQRGRKPFTVTEAGGDDTAQLRRREAELRDRLRQRLSSLSAEREAAASTAAAAGLLPPLAELEQAGAWLALLQQALQQHDEAAAGERRLAAKLAELREREEELRKSRRECAGKLRQHEQARGELAGRWNRWLEDCRLQHGYTPDAVLEILQMVEQAEQIVRQRDKALAKQTALQSQVDRFKEAAVRWLGIEAERDPVLALKQWKEKLEEHERNQAAGMRIQEKMRELDEQASMVKEQLTRLEQRLLQLFYQAGARDEEQLRILARQHGEREELKRELARLTAMLNTWIPADGTNSYVQLLERHDEESLRLQAEQQEQELAAIEEELNEARDLRGRLQHEIERLEEGADHGRKLQRLEECKAELKQQAARWAVLSMCSRLFVLSKQMYEKERQPAVLQRASVYFARLTGGRFNRVAARFGEQRLLAERADGQLLDTSQLSRGTAEQLYLAMRFAFIDEYSRHIQLPLIMDDILVNFDADRMRNSLALLKDLSLRHQILLFTCHDHVREQALGLIPGLHLIEL
jgi:uncharacterized protein YhaN